MSKCYIRKHFLIIFLPKGVFVPLHPHLFTDFNISQLFNAFAAINKKMVWSELKTVVLGSEKYFYWYLTSRNGFVNSMTKRFAGMQKVLKRATKFWGKGQSQNSDSETLLSFKSLNNFSKEAGQITAISKSRGQTTSNFFSRKQ